MKKVLLIIYKETVYGWEGVIGTEFSIIAIDVENGNIKYKKAVPNAGTGNLFATTMPVVSKEKVIYALRPENNLVALKDNGDSLSFLWNIPIVDGGYSKPAIGPDGSVYFTNHKRIMRAESSEGNILDSSIIIQADTVQYQNGYFAIDAIGTVYFNNNANPVKGVLFCFTKDLELIWSDSIMRVGHGGPALSKHGLLAIAGANSILRVYKPDSLSTQDQIIFTTPPPVTHICTPLYISFKYYVQYHTDVRLLLYNTRGQEVYSYEGMPGTPGCHIVNIRYIHRSCGSGRFVYKLDVGGESAVNALSIVE